MIPPTITIEAVTLPDAWARLVKSVMREGMNIQTEYGPLSKDVCSVTTITHPFEEPMLHSQFPTKEQHLSEYIKQFERDYDWKKQGFKYTYVDRLTKYPVKGLDNSNPYKVVELDQLERIKEQIGNLITTHTRRAQAITWIPEVDMYDDEPPCLQRMWFRKLTPSTVEMHCDWRSRDLYAAWNSNYVAILNMVKREILDPLDLKLVKLVDFVDSLHIYQTDWIEASKVNLFPINPTLR